MIRGIARMIVAILVASFVQIAEASEKPKRNALFIAVDDLQPELSVHGKDVISPNIDRLARAGTVFNYDWNSLPPFKQATIWTRRRNRVSIVRPSRTTI